MFKSKSAKTAIAVAPSEGSRLPLTYVGAGSEFQGNLRTAGNLRVDGTIKGSVHVEGDVEVSASGVIEGESVSGRNIMVHGCIKAKVRAAEQLRIHGRGRVEGDVSAQSLDIEAGAQFIGYSSTGAAAESRPEEAPLLESASTSAKRTESGPEA